MKQDIFEQSKKKVKNTMIFEINDTDRGHEYKARPTVYVAPFISFLESLGFEPTQKYEGATDFTIDGVEFGIGLDSASYMSHQAYTRIAAIRKNRFVSIERGYKVPSINVPINKDIDTDKLKKRIKDAVQQAKDKKKSVEDSRAKDQQNLEAVVMHYTRNPLLRKHIDRVTIEAGVIKFGRKYSCIVLSATGEFKRHDGWTPQIEKEAELESILANVSHDLSLVPLILKMLKSVGPLPADLIAFVERERHFSTYDLKK